MSPKGGETSPKGGHDREDAEEDVVPGPGPSKKKRHVSYNKRWEEKHAWVKPVSAADQSRVFCTLCRREFSIRHGGEYDLKQHASSAMHKRRTTENKANTNTASGTMSPEGGTTRQTESVRLEITGHMPAVWEGEHVVPFPGPSKKKRHVSYNKKWEEKHAWVKPVSEEQSRVFCTLCRREFSIRGGECDLKQHASTAMHKHRTTENKGASGTMSPPISPPPISWHDIGGGTTRETESVLRLQITGHMLTVGEQMVCVLEKRCTGVDDVAWLRGFVSNSLGEAAEFICSLFQREMEALLLLHTAAPEDEQQKTSSGLVHEEPQPPQIKERPEEANRSPLMSLEEARSVHDENRETEPITESDAEGDVDWADTMEGQAAVNSQLLSSESDAEGDVDWADTMEGQAAVNSLKSYCFESDTEERSGLKTTHTKSRVGKKSFPCSHCSRRFSAKKKLRDHTMIHTGEKPFTCTVCGKSFRKKSHLKRHLKTKRCQDAKGLVQEEPQPPQIKERPEEANRSLLMSLEEARSVHDENRETEPVTGTSTQHVTTQAEVEDQLLSSESDAEDGKSFPCSHCGKRFSLEKNLRVHTMIHTGEKPFTCTLCGKGFIQKGNLKRHLKTNCCRDPEATSTRIRIKNKTYVCSYCGKNFASKTDLDRHTMIHKREKRFLCTYCGKMFKLKIDLERHTMVHTGEKPFKCAVCGKGFIRISQLKVHKMVHTGERPFTCIVCGKGFFRLQALKKHEMLHTGEKSFHCRICGKGFSVPDYVRTHMKTHRVVKKNLNC